MDDNKDEIYRIVAERAAKMQEQAAQKKEAEEKKAAPAGPRLFYDATFNAERAERIAPVWFPLLREIFPESVRDEASRKDLFTRMFKKRDAYISRQWMRDLYKALKNCSWQYLTDKDKVGLNPKEKEILSRSDTKRHRFMEIIVETTNISA